MITEDPIVVGIDGSAAAWRALDWAADEAERTDRRLHVVHVGDTEPPTDESVDDRPFGSALLSEAVARLAETHDKVDVKAELFDGLAADVLIQLSLGADLLVVGRGRRTIAGLLLGSVAYRVLAHAHCATVVVSVRAEVTDNRIVVGVSDSVGGTAALLFAAAEAFRRDAELVAVRSWSAREWRLAAAAALPISSPELWEVQERAVLEECVQEIRDAYPELRIRTVLSATPTEIALEQESRGAEMLVLGCRRADDARFARLGPIASWAAHHFDTPVVIVGNSVVTAAD